MNETYTTIDTFSIDALQQNGNEATSGASVAGAGYHQPASSSVVPVIARVPDVSSENKSLRGSNQEPDTTTQIYSRIDQATSHQPLAHTRSRTSLSTSHREVEAYEAIRSADLFLGNKNSAEDASQPKFIKPQQTTQPSPEPVTSQPKKDIEYNNPQAENWSDLWLLQAEAAVVPFTKWIVLAVVLAALALALVLVQGSKPQTVNPTDSLLFADVENTPTNNEAIETGILEPLKNGTETVPSPNLSMAATESTKHNTDLALTEGVIVNRPVGLPYRAEPSTVAGQDSSSKEAPQAELVGQIVPIEPYRTTKTRVASQAYEAPSVYPSTLSNGQQTNSNGMGSQIR